RVPSSSIDIRREYPTTSAATIAASRRWTSVPGKAGLHRVRDRIIVLGSSSVVISTALLKVGVKGVKGCSAHRYSWRGRERGSRTSILALSAPTPIDVRILLMD